MTHLRQMGRKMCIQNRDDATFRPINMPTKETNSIISKNNILFRSGYVCGVASIWAGFSIVCSIRLCRRPWTKFTYVAGPRKSHLDGFEAD